MKKTILILALLIVTSTAHAQRSTDQLQALYNFNQSSGDVISDIGPDLLISNTNNVQWTNGGLLILAPVTIESTTPASNIVASVMASNEVTLELWLRNANITASGPARIVSISESGMVGGNIMFGQSGQGLEVRCLTTESDQWGVPALTISQLFDTVSDITHIVYTRNTIGDTKIYVNGFLMATSFIGGQLSNWGNHTLTLASESNDDGSRSWLGELRLCAIYSKALSQTEVTNNYNAGEGVIEPPITGDYNPMIPARVMWSAPTTGTQAVKYVIEYSKNNDPWIPYAIAGDTTAVVDITFFDQHRVRVAGVDINNNQGAFSVPSNIYIPSSVLPHPPTRPTRIQ